MDTKNILEVANLKTHFFVRPNVAKAVDGVSFNVPRGKTVAVVGESGCGKSVTSLSIMRLLSHPGKIVGGEIRYRSQSKGIIDLSKLSLREMRAIRGKELAMIFQEPMTSLNPLMTVGNQVAEMIMLHESVSYRAALQRTEKLFELVEISSAKKRVQEYPHHLSGGMRQRVMIAMAIACNPSLLIADEPTTALDVTIQAQILDILRKLQSELGMSILFITHNLGVVAEMADDVVVMYAGQVIESASVEEIFRNPKHPYTLGLMNSVPNAAQDRLAGGGRARLTPIPGNIPSLSNLPQGCNFSPRCSHTIDTCTAKKPDLTHLGHAHQTRCWRHDDL
ncbi:ABC transporter ATP-binding protein [Pusillimonas sp. SM2304]|uniref:ABC transporter ATP-binding protein n=1 Tax=Pusillimonas sp. SM2304 TaxID=3073241 RepID=UPI0028745B77|nr:ABC transporter ATP-binding protein [Pusillimonas sp. SM2304]MDS1140116.1 ABC transporter ATP-binding protein [Pusillimonas sp. SM2304]